MKNVISPFNAVVALPTLGLMVEPDVSTSVPDDVADSLVVQGWTPDDWTPEVVAPKVPRPRKSRKPRTKPADKPAPSDPKDGA